MIASQIYFTIYLLLSQRRLIHDAYRPRSHYNPNVLLTVPCKGLDTKFEENIKSFYNIDYSDYAINFVVESEEDLAYAKLLELKNCLLSASKAKSAQVLIAGVTNSCSQKNHNLLHSVDTSEAGVEVFAFADSDACVKPYWMEKLVNSLRKDKYGATTGYRWFVPTRNNFATLALSSLNAKVAQLLGRTRFNQAWGGSMAIKKTDFNSFGIHKLWENSISDDLSISYAVKNAKKQISFAPACLVASYDETSFSELIEFMRRQFIITKVATPKVWLMGLVSALYSFCGSWGALIGAIFAFRLDENWKLLALISAIFFIGTTLRAITRQIVITKLLPENKEQLRTAAIFDIVMNSLWSIVMLVLICSTVFSRTIVWRNIYYKLISPEKTQILPKRP